MNKTCRFDNVFGLYFEKKEKFFIILILEYVFDQSIENPIIIQSK